jgi:hypothetical protein
MAGENEHKPDPSGRWVRHRSWRPWRIDTQTRELVIRGAAYSYEIDLDSCTSSAQVLDWIAQVSHKTWATDRVLAGLIRALDDCFGFQENLRQDHVIPLGFVAERIRKRLSTRRRERDLESDTDGNEG